MEFMDIFSRFFDTLLCKAVFSSTFDFFTSNYNNRSICTGLAPDPPVPHAKKHDGGYACA
jgi:hypothetical protein